jgi:hypothetical protein
VPGQRLKDSISMLCKGILIGGLCKFLKSRERHTYLGWKSWV